MLSTRQERETPLAADRAAEAATEGAVPCSETALLWERGGLPYAHHTASHGASDGEAGALVEPSTTALDATDVPWLLGTGDRPPSRRAEARRVEALPQRPEPAPARIERILLRRLARDFVRGMVCVLALHLFVLQISVVRGHSMEPGLQDGDRLVVDRLAYTLTEVGRFDVVVLRYPKDPGLDFVKRVVGLPGDRVAICNGRVLVDGQPLAEEFAHVCDHADMRELVVPPDHYFVLGDNRPISCDSREFGLVEGGLLRGKVRARFWPPERAGTL